VTSEPSNNPVPDDFPRNRQPTSVSGYQQKLALRKVDGQFVEGWTDEELHARFDACSDLVEQLTAYSKRKLAEKPEMSVAALLPKVRRGIEGKGWDLTEAELDWVMARVAKNMCDLSVGKCGR
jgi:hypothetical protein